jgi:hypothetical protein
MHRQFGRVLQLFWSPGKAVGDLAERPGYLVPLVVVAVGAVLTGLIMNRFALTIIEASMQAALDADRAEHALEAARRLQIVGYALTPLVVLFRWFVIAGLLFLMTVLLNGEMRFRAAFSLIACAGVCPLVQSCFSLLIVVFKGSDRLHTPADLQPPIGANLLFTEAAEPLYTILGAVNPFEIWYLVVLVMGVRTLSKCSRFQAAVVVLSTWCLLISLKAAFAMFGRA